MFCYWVLGIAFWVLGFTLIILPINAVSTAPLVKKSIVEKCIVFFLNLLIINSLKLYSSNAIL
jgi:hypothetical protein